MRWEVEYRDEFGAWWETLDWREQRSILVAVTLLEAEGPQLGFPLTSGVVSSRHPHMRELRIRHRGAPFRVFYAFDPRRVAILLIGGRKAGGKRWYKRMVPWADRLYDEHLEELRKEGEADGA